MDASEELADILLIQSELGELPHLITVDRFQWPSHCRGSLSVSNPLGSKPSCVSVSISLSADTKIAVLDPSSIVSMFDIFRASCTQCTSEIVTDANRVSESGQLERQKNPGLRSPGFSRLRAGVAQTGKFSRMTSISRAFREFCPIRRQGNKNRID
jgi:hypothetical protein